MSPVGTVWRTFASKTQLWLLLSSSYLGPGPNLGQARVTILLMVVHLNICMTLFQKSNFTFLALSMLITIIINVDDVVDDDNGEVDGMRPLEPQPWPFLQSRSNCLGLPPLLSCYHLAT